MMEYKKQETILIPRVIAIAGGKGGTGKTLIAVNLASALQQSGKQVFLMDGDFGLANIHVLLGENTDRDLESVLSGECPLNEILLPTSEGFKIIPGGRGKPFMASLGPGKLQGLISAFDQLHEAPDILLIDTAGGISNEELQLVAAAGEVAVVVTPDILALQDAAEYIRQMFSNHDIQRFSVIVNQAKSQRAAQKIMEKLHNLVGFDVDVILTPIGWVPPDETMAKSVLSMSSVLLFDPASRTARQFSAMADKLCNQTVKPAFTGGLSFFYERKIKSEGM